MYKTISQLILGFFFTSILQAQRPISKNQIDSLINEYCSSNAGFGDVNTNFCCKIFYYSPLAVVIDSSAIYKQLAKNKWYAENFELIELSKLTDLRESVLCDLHPTISGCMPFTAAYITVLDSLLILEYCLKQTLFDNNLEWKPYLFEHQPLVLFSDTLAVRKNELFLKGRKLHTPQLEVSNADEEKIYLELKNHEQQFRINPNSVITNPHFGLVFEKLAILAVSGNEDAQLAYQKARQRYSFIKASVAEIYMNWLIVIELEKCKKQKSTFF